MKSEQEKFNPCLPCGRCDFEKPDLCELYRLKYFFPAYLIKSEYLFVKRVFEENGGKQEGNFLTLPYEKKKEVEETLVSKDFIVQTIESTIDRLKEIRYSTKIRKDLDERIFWYCQHNLNMKSGIILM